MTMEVPNYTIDDFLRDMGRPLQYREPTTIKKFWVFWSQEGKVWPHHPQSTDVFSSSSFTNNNWENVQEYLKSLLCNAEDACRENVVLIQFWAPTTSMFGWRCVLKTSNHPFALRKIERGLCEYRKRCTSLEFNIFQDEEKKYKDDFGSIIGRIFKDKKADYTKHDLLYDFAHNCGMQRSLLLPLFKPSSQCCSGVLELVCISEHRFRFYEPCREAKAIFEEANFMKPPPFESQQSTEIEEINKTLQGVCTTLQLPLAQIWIPCCTSTAMAYADSPGERCHSPYLSCSRKFSSSISQNGDDLLHYAMKDFNFRSKRYSYRKGEGIVGKALLYHKPCLCRDVTRLPIAEYPLSNVAHFHGLTGCYAIWLHSTYTNNHDYVLEFFLPPWNTISGDPQTYLELLLATVKKQLPGFKIGSVGEESCVEIFEISVNDDEPDSIMISQITGVQPVPESFANERETVQNEVVRETVIDNGSNILDLEQNGIAVCHSEKTAADELFVEAATNDEITIRLPAMPESLRNDNDESTMEEVVRKNELNVGIVKQTSEAVTSSERIFSKAEASESEYRTTDITLSREDLTKHFGKKLDDAAQILGVSRSTMKRALRLHKIDKWPLPKRKKVVRSGNEGIEGTYKGNPLCSDSSPTPATSGISHKTSNSRQEQDVGNVTIKATHGNKNFRFKLPFLSRKSDLVEKVTMRVSLNEGSFNIQYQDEENDWISIACDEDLEECIGIWKGKNKIIKMLVEPITNQAP